MRPITKKRTVELQPREIPTSLSPHERFGFQRRSQPEHSSPELTFETPAGWTKRAPSGSRALDFEVDQDTECYLTLLPGMAGGLAGNVNRWRTQMGHGPLDAAGIEAMPKIPFLGGTATLLDIEGPFNDGDEIREDFRMLGLLSFTNSGARFLKLTGPRETVSGERDAFLALARSLRMPNMLGDVAQSPHASTGSESAEPARETSVDPPETNSAGGLRWDLPKGWRLGQPKMMRVANFLVGDPPVECYISVLGGDGGGLLANLNRWRRQQGQAEMTEDESQELPRVPMLGSRAILAEIPSPDGTSLMLGTVCMLGDISVYVKMTGPTETVDPERGAFLDLCRSLTLER